MKNNDKYEDLIQKIKENRISDEEIIECLQIRQISVNYTVLSHIYLNNLKEEKYINELRKLANDDYELGRYLYKIWMIASAILYIFTGEKSEMYIKADEFEKKYIKEIIDNPNYIF